MALAAVWAAASGLAGFLSLQTANAATPATRNCTMDAIKQSICIYEAILADVDKNYPMRGGGGIGRIVQNSTTSYSIYILQEEREDVRKYTVQVDPKGKVTILSVTEETITH
ncbi:MAG TPA: hypothetical protein PKI41_12410 [Candidatus Competibacteraceae bacterium]|nr:MAG: hypothetical protein EKK71_12260 [Candidatus Competibacteraceae bacterium]HOB62900.1 hypothetical protein [Candidatus Competibacteraceae bacterium]HQA26368.1 hypothetical protein [Candidatus Competibacteraceae bacterium]HQD57552.1 hypothetical protein [Candidatus Competibacteraceae bacterium]